MSDTYVVQIFPNFEAVVPSEGKLTDSPASRTVGGPSINFRSRSTVPCPLIVRLPADASTLQVIDIVLRHAELPPLILQAAIARQLLSTTAGATVTKVIAEHLQFQQFNKEDFALYPALGDGTPDLTQRPIVEDILRSANLSFPFMLALVHLPTVNDTAQDTITPSTRSNKVGSATQKSGISSASKSYQSSFAQSEKEQFMATLAEVNERRESNLREIERRRMIAEENHLNHCESYEVLRQEQLKATKQEVQQQQQQLAAQEAEFELRQAVLRKQQSDAEEALRREQQATQERELADRQARAQIVVETRMAQKRRDEEAKAEELRHRRSEAERLKKEKIEAVMAQLVIELDESIEKDRQEADHRFQQQIERRRLDEFSAQELRSISHLEQTRSAKKQASRQGRTESETLQREREELRRLNELELSIAEQEREASRLQDWKGSKRQSLETFQSQIEYQHRKVAH